MTPVPVKRGRKPGSGRGGRGKSRGGGRGGRSQNSTPSTTPIVSGKRERSPSLDSATKASVRGKVAKLTPLPIDKSQESPRSLRSRGGQNQNYPSPADEAPINIHQQQRTNRRKTETEDAEMSQPSPGTPTGESWKTRSLMPPASVAVQKAQESGSTGESTDSSGKRIPRLIDLSAANRREALSGVTPLDWTPQDVAQFLRVNDYTAYCDNFTKSVSTPSLTFYDK